MSSVRTPLGAFIINNFPKKIKTFFGQNTIKLINFKPIKVFYHNAS